MNKKTAVLRGIAAVTAFLLFVTVSGSNLMFTYAGIINSQMNVETSKVIMADGADGDDTFYYESEYGTDVNNKQAALQVELNAATENILQAEEGSVLLKNDGALPMAQGSRVTVFGNGSYNSANTSFPGSDGSTTAFDSIPVAYLNSALQEALGTDNVNLTLAENVYKNLGETSESKVVEAPISDVIKYENTWENDFNDYAIVMISRDGSEGNDNSFYTEEGNRYLALQPNEMDLMNYLKEQKEAGVFKKIVVLINSDQLMELGWLDEYEVDACMVTGLPGATGYTGIANLLIGEANPSGHLVDTYAANSQSAPANTYFGENTQTWTNSDWVNANCADSGTDGANIDNYIIYAEGIYVGYKYYETRYEDVVMGTGNADSPVGSSTDGAWNYDQEVVFPFGYGLSYTEFSQKLTEVNYNAETDCYEVQVEVTNTGAVSGKSVVQVYAQTPYGDYEKENRVEKAAVQLVGFQKTGELAPGESETVTVDVRRYMLASYDTYGAQGYILSAGNYYLAIGENAHDALNNILAAKGYTTENGMTEEGDTAKVYNFNQTELDTQSYAVNPTTGVEVTNAFDKADINTYGIDFTYLSRSDWAGTYPVKALAVEATEEMVADLSSDWYETPADAPSVDSFTQGADNGIRFSDLRLVDWDDEETWEKTIDQLTVEEMLALTADSRGTVAIDSIQMPAVGRNDNGMGVNGSLTAVGKSALLWASNVMTARTWSYERYEGKGKAMAQEALFSGDTEIWYGGGNIHRTASGGRIREYTSEDGNFSYIVNAAIAAAMQERGIIYSVKHFALNDQETGRMGVSTFSNEQAIREIYLRSFEGAFVEGGALGVMQGFNRIGCIYTSVNQNLLTTVLKGEWGFKGHCTTDGYVAVNSFENHFAEQLAAGLDYCCVDAGAYGEGLKELVAQDGYLLQCLRLAAKHNLYAISRTVAENGLSSNSIIITIVPAWQKALLIATAAFAVSFIGCSIAYVVCLFKKKNEDCEEQGEKIS